MMQRFLPPLYQYVNQHAKSLITALVLVAITLLAWQVRTDDYAQWPQYQSVFFVEGQPVLTNADGYYYLRLARDMMADKYEQIDEQRSPGDQLKRPFPPPLLASFTALISTMFDVPIAKVAIFLPPLLGATMAWLMYLLMRAIGTNRLAALSASLLAALSVMFVDRTRLGFYDTDSMNVIFPLLSSYLLLRFANLKSKRRYYFLVGALINYLLFLMWWDQAPIIVTLTVIPPLMVALWCWRLNALQQWITLTSILLIFFALLWWLFSISTIDVLANAGVLISGLLPQENEVFANAGNNIIELLPANLNTLIATTVDNVVLFFVAVAAFIFFMIKRFRDALFLLPITGLALLPFYLGSRFSIYSGVIISIGSGLAIHYIDCFICHYIYRDKFNKQLLLSRVFMIIVLLSLTVISVQLYHKNTAGLIGARTHTLFSAALAIKQHTPDNALIWSNWTSGYPFEYYAKRATLIDGAHALDFERQVYNNIPMVASSQKMAANFMKFVGRYGVKGMHKVYQLFADKNTALNFLKTLFALDVNAAKALIEQQISIKNIQLNNHFAEGETLLKFLFPAPKQPLFLVFNSEWVKDGSWYRQGSWDIEQRKGTAAVFIHYENVAAKNGRIVGNNGLDFDINKGWQLNVVSGELNINGQLAHLFTHLGDTTQIKEYGQGELAFEWLAPFGYGALMSKEIADSVFNQLFIRHQYQPNYFKPVALKTPAYQIWQVVGDVY